jgi:ABC-type uncharacterized transport system auxiliary subunit
MIRARRLVLSLPLGLAACTVLPDRPYQETQRFALLPERPSRNPPAPRRPVLLLRSLRAAPGLETRSLRSVSPDGQVRTAAWAEWAAPPAELAEEALRRWLMASGRFAAVTAPGSRIRPSYVLEGELTRLETLPTEARAGLALLLANDDAAEVPRLLAPILAEGSAPLPGGAAASPADAAAAMRAALAEALAMAERGIAGALGPGLA